MKRLFSLIASLLVAFAFFFVSCTEKTVSVTGVSLDRTTAELKVGETLQLTAAVKPAEATDAAVTWKSDAPEVASVDADGKVKALKAGNAKITVTTADGGMTATCAVTVKDFVTLRYFSSNVSGGFANARDAEDEMVEAVFFSGSVQTIFFLTEDGVNPYADKEASHYSITDIKAASGVIDAERSMVYVEKLAGVECGQYVIRFLSPGTAEFTLNYNDGTRSFSKTIKFTVEDKVHDIGFVAGTSSHVLAMGRWEYEGPRELDSRVFFEDNYYLWIRAWDKSTNRMVGAGSFSLDPDNDGPSSALYEASVQNVDDAVECIRVKFNTPGYINIGVRFDGGEKKKASGRLCFYTYTALSLRTAKHQYVGNNEEFKLKEGETQSFEFYNSYRDRNEEIVADSLKITGGNASIATLERAADGKTLVLKGKKEGTTSWTVAYSYFGMTIASTTVKVTVSNTVPVTSVKIVSPTKSLQVGEILTEKVLISPSDATDQTVTWESSNPTVARIAQSGGIYANIEGVSPGNASITARCGGQSDSYVVSVKASFEIWYNGSKASSTLTYKPGTHLSDLLPFTFYNSYLKASVNPVDTKITTIYSSNENVAKFYSFSQDKMYIQAKSTGTTTLTFYVGGQSIGSVTLTVVPAPEVRSQITGKAVASTEYYVLGYLSGNQVRFEMFDRFTNQYYYPTSGLSISSSNTSVATASVGTYSGHQVWYVKALQAGSSTISFRYNGDLVKSITYSVRNDHDMVDLGLGVKWATVNMGASQPQEPGNLFAWGETQGKSDYSWSTYKWGTTSLTKYTYRDGKMTLEADDDVAQVWWGWGWRMPTNAEFSDLCTKCTWTETTLSGVNVFKITGTNGNSIYIPLAGNYVGTTLQLYGTSVIYWTSERLGGYDDSAKTMVANKGSSRGSTGQVSPRCQGMYVRAVKPK